MIDRELIEEAVQEAERAHIMGERAAYRELGADLKATTEYATRYVEVSLSDDRPVTRVMVGAFLLAFELGVRAARIQVERL